MTAAEDDIQHIARMTDPVHFTVGQWMGFICPYHWLLYGSRGYIHFVYGHPQFWALLGFT